jgi:hypothetical protein
LGGLVSIRLTKRLFNTKKFANLTQNPLVSIRLTKRLFNTSEDLNILGLGVSLLFQYGSPKGFSILPDTQSVMK